MAQAENASPPTTTATSDEVVYVPLGGAGEIGMNLYLYGVGPKASRKWLMVDLGVTFPGDLEPGVDLILPDTQFIEREGDNLVGIILTHAHEDHFGAVIDLWPDLKVPVYATPFASGLLKAKLSAYPIEEPPEITEVKQGARFNVGPFDCEFINVAHSIPEPNALVIRAGGKTILHTGDWKIDDDPVVGSVLDVDRIEEIGRDGIDVLVCDSTNVFREGISPTEGEVGASLAAIIKAAPGRVAVTTFASNVARILSVAKAAKAAGRHLVLVGRAMLRVTSVAQEIGALPPEFTFLSQDEYRHLKPSETVVLLTGSQGEPRAALARVAFDAHPDIRLDPGDTVIFSSRTIPGNENSVGRVQNALAGQGLKLITDSDALVHVTGHPRRQELQQMYRWCQPKALIPMHGERRHLEEHVRFAKENGIADALVVANGQMAMLSQAPLRIIDEVHCGRVYRDGELILESDDASVRERRRLAEVGIVFVALAVTKRGDLVAPPQVEIDGIPPEDELGEALAATIAKGVEGALKSIPKPKRKDVGLVREAARRAARGSVNRSWGKKPVVKAVVSVISNGK